MKSFVKLKNEWEKKIRQSNLISVTLWQKFCKLNLKSQQQFDIPNVVAVLSAAVNFPLLIYVARLGSKAHTLTFSEVKGVSNQRCQNLSHFLWWSPQQNEIFLTGKCFWSLIITPACN